MPWLLGTVLLSTVGCTHTSFWIRVFSGYIARHLAYTQEALNKYVGCEPSVRPNYTQRGMCVWGLPPPAHAGLGKSPTSVQILVSNKGPGRTLVVAFPGWVTAHHGSDAMTITGMHLSPHPPNSSGTRDSHRAPGPTRTWENLNPMASWRFQSLLGVHWPHDQHCLKRFDTSWERVN